jgi:hypothetical protein
MTWLLGLFFYFPTMLGNDFRIGWGRHDTRERMAFRMQGHRRAAVVQPHAFPSSMQLNGRKKSKQRG